MYTFNTLNRGNDIQRERAAMAAKHERMPERTYALALPWSSSGVPWWGGEVWFHHSGLCCGTPRLWCLGGLPATVTPAWENTPSCLDPRKCADL